ncbi:Mpo1 family 2-hydroxy fatty acid dioxygenase [Hylemonella gracilis]|uniref:PRS2 protein n=1 Tax=Hylemonella gracilis ATCC 19624 TaxID=887062 RepID=F3KQG9_9BURK|nr:Mpo1-like protein [Hylemonella gracilis]EGI77952.1 hypothetical protein HGR_03442 [Hylemonella gracilis ATCC 19624]
MTTLTQAKQDRTTRRVDQLLDHYGESHQNPANELIHYAAIPLIMLSIVGLIFAIHPLAAYAFIGASLIYYIRLSRLFTLAMAAISAIGLALVHLMGDYRVAICASIFVVAWIFQFIGHRIEGKKPSFFEDVQYLWVGPLFVLSHLFLKRGLRW